MAKTFAAACAYLRLADHIAGALLQGGGGSGVGGVGSSDPNYGAVESTSSVKVAVVVSQT